MDWDTSNAFVVRHSIKMSNIKLSIYRILCYPLASDNEVKSKRLNNDPNRQIIEQNETIKHLEKHMRKDQTSCSEDNSKVVIKTTKSRTHVELDSVNNNKYSLYVKCK